jgi:hypothetical protein
MAGKKNTRIKDLPKKAVSQKKASAVKGGATTVPRKPN